MIYNRSTSTQKRKSLLQGICRLQAWAVPVFWVHKNQNIECYYILCATKRCYRAARSAALPWRASVPQFLHCITYQLLTLCMARGYVPSLCMQLSQLYYPGQTLFHRTWLTVSSDQGSWLRRKMIMRWEYRYHSALSDFMATTFAKSWLWTQLLVFPEQAWWWLTEEGRCQLQILWTKTIIMLQWTGILIAAKCMFSLPSFCSGLIFKSYCSS